MSARLVLLPPDVAEYIKESVAPVATVELRPSRGGRTLLRMTETAERYLRTFKESDDGHLDPDGNLWVQGSEYRTWPV